MKNASFYKTVVNVKELPNEGMPEVALCGRSNVGKSSFINSLLNRKNLAKTSSAPGKTRGLNYYLVENKFYFVDLPGFGYAKVSKKERDAWERLIDSYFRSSNNLSLALHFIDSRHEPTKLDILLNDYLSELEIPYIVMLNKADKLKQSEVAKIKRSVKSYFPELSEGDNMMLYSAVTGVGKGEIKNILGRLFL